MYNYLTKARFIIVNCSLSKLTVHIMVTKDYFSAALLGISVGCETLKHKECSSQNGSSDVTNCAISQEGTEVASTKTTDSHVQPANGCTPTAQETVLKITNMYLDQIKPSTKKAFDDFKVYLTEIRGLLVKKVEEGSLLITVRCKSLQVLEDLWTDYTSGHLNEVVQTYLVTEHVLNDFGLSELKLTTTIREDDYKACKQILQVAG